MAEDKSRKTLEDLDARLRRASDQRTRQTSSEERRMTNSGVGLAFRIALDIVAGTALGVAIGYGLDYWLGTLPLFLIVFLLLGFAGGFMNVYRTLTGKGLAAGYWNTADKATTATGKDGPATNAPEKPGQDDRRPEG